MALRARLFSSNLKAAYSAYLILSSLLRACGLLPKLGLVSGLLIDVSSFEMLVAVSSCSETLLALSSAEMGSLRNVGSEIRGAGLTRLASGPTVLFSFGLSSLATSLDYYLLGVAISGFFVSSSFPEAVFAFTSSVTFADDEFVS